MSFQGHYDNTVGQYETIREQRIASQEDKAGQEMRQKLRDEESNFVRQVVLRLLTFGMYGGS